MTTVVVYESCYGNTRSIAEAIADSLREVGEVALVSVDDPLPDLAGVDLLVVGGPTHVHGLSSSMSRKAALKDHADSNGPGIGVRDWLRELPAGGGRSAAAFDTRIEKSIVLVGSAARAISRRLRHHGYALVGEPESFFVLDAEGPLKTAETERAAAWARELAARSAPLVVR
jgi:hypothetical protein